MDFVIKSLNKATANFIKRRQNRLKIMLPLVIFAAAFLGPRGALIGRPSVGRGAARYHAQCSAADADPLRDAAAAIESIYGLPCSQEVRRRTAIAHRETFDKTHAQLWGASEWSEHTRTDRYLYIVRTWPWSRLAHALMPAMLELALWSIFVWRQQLKLTTSAIGFLASPLGLLLAFRVNSVVGRFHEARRFWTQMSSTARNLASMLAASDTDEISLAERAMCGRYLVAYVWCVRSATRFQPTPAPLLGALLTSEEAALAESSRKPALAVMSLLRRATQGRPLKAHVARGVHEAINELNRLYGGIERLISTPLSPTYARQTQRALLLWLHMLPCGLLSSGCASVGGLVFVVLAVAYIMLAIDEISVQIDNPFDVMPCTQLAKNFTEDVVDELFTYL